MIALPLTGVSAQQATQPTLTKSAVIYSRHMQISSACLQLLRLALFQLLEPVVAPLL